MKPAQWVCFGDVCECSGEEYSCNCVAVHGSHTGVCLCCREPMHEIDMDTGEPEKAKMAQP